MALISFSPAMERSMETELHNPTDDRWQACIDAFGKNGLPEDKSALWNVLQLSADDGSSIERNKVLALALSTAKAWVLTDSEVKLLTPYLDKMPPPVSSRHQIDLSDGTNGLEGDPTSAGQTLWSVDQYDLTNKADFEAKLLQFPAGTKFEFDTDGKPWRAKMLKEIGVFLAAHSMSISDAPERSKE